MIENINFNEKENKLPRLIFVSKVGTICGENLYRLLYSDNIDEVWMEQWSEKPACNCRYLCPEPEFVSYTKEIKTPIDLITCTSACCNSFTDITDGVLSIAYENIDNYAIYPEPFRIVLHFGDTMEEVDKILAQRDIVSKFVLKMTNEEIPMEDMSVSHEVENAADRLKKNKIYRASENLSYVNYLLKIELLNNEK